MIREIAPLLPRRATTKALERLGAIWANNGLAGPDSVLVEFERESRGPVTDLAATCAARVKMRLRHCSSSWQQPHAFGGDGGVRGIPIGSESGRQMECSEYLKRRGVIKCAGRLQPGS
jgi:hypothetical protein